MVKRAGGLEPPASRSYGRFLPRRRLCNAGCTRARGRESSRRDIRDVDEQRLILIVEDDEATRAFLAENILADGFRVASASSAAEGLRAIEVPRPSLVLLALGVGWSCALHVAFALTRTAEVRPPVTASASELVTSAQADQDRDAGGGAGEREGRPEVARLAASSVRERMPSFA
jgi:CheY-like chemotaxis protein